MSDETPADQSALEPQLEANEPPRSGCRPKACDGRAREGRTEAIQWLYPSLTLERAHALAELEVRRAEKTAEEANAILREMIDEWEQDDERADR